MSGPGMVHTISGGFDLGEVVTAHCGFTWAPTKTPAQMRGVPYCPLCHPNYAVKYLPPREADPHYVYRLYDAQDQLLYIGATVDPRTRRLGHKNKTWWPEVARFRLTIYPDKQTALRVESEAIRTEHPIHNIRGRVKLGVVPA